MSAPVPPLLVAEHNPNDMFLFTRLLKAAGASHALHIALDGQEAVRLLQPVVKKSSLVVRPAVAFLDVDLPKISGLDVLTWIRARRELDALPVVMMAGRVNRADVIRANEAGAQCYLVKFPGKLALGRLLENALHFTGHDGIHLFDLPDNLLRRHGGKHPL